MSGKIEVGKNERIGENRYIRDLFGYFLFVFGKLRWIIYRWLTYI